MSKALGTLSAVVAFCVQLLTLKELAGRDHHVQGFIVAVQQATIRSDTGASAPPPERRLSLAYLRYAFKAPSADAWHCWLMLSLAIGTLVFVGVWTKETVSWGFVDLEDAGTAIASGVIIMISVSAVKVLWMLLR